MPKQFNRAPAPNTQTEMETTHTAPAMQPQGTQPERNVTSYEVSGLEVKLTIDYVKKYIARGVAGLTDEEL